MKKEIIARFVVLALTLGALVGTLVAWSLRRGNMIEIHAAMPQRGGWLTDRLTIHAGQPLTLRLISDDVVHGFAIGQLDFKPIDLLPGKPVEVSLTFDQPGTYTFYCTRWCGADHWRMRGTIIVTGGTSAFEKAPDLPLYLQLGLNLDTSHDVPGLMLEQRPSAARGAALLEALSSASLQTAPSSPHPPSTNPYLTISPYTQWETLRGDPQTSKYSNQDIWDIVAWEWQQFTSAKSLAEGQALYQRDCAACHGVTGAGDGIFQAVAKAKEDAPSQTASDRHSTFEPVDFTNPAQMLGASSALLQGKIIRGGMGTGMPSWGLVYTGDQTWSLVDYLWTFQFDYDFKE